MLNLVPSIYNVNNSNISKILNVHAEEIYEAQKNIGRILSDNYIRVPINNEIRVRNSTAKDLIANENCFKLKRVSTSASGSNTASNTIEISDSSYRSHEDNLVISLQEVFTDETINYLNIKESEF